MALWGFVVVSSQLVLIARRRRRESIDFSRLQRDVVDDDVHAI